jgi:16S rRNA (cytidine1402-2'-O)-methyltransferase
LYVVATPIGNLADLSVRALAALSLCDAVACEDTRHTRPMLQALGLDKPLLAAHQHNEHEAAQTILARLGAGERVALVSDAGTPGISDPGAVLVAAVRAAGHRVVPLPGASSATAAVSAAGVTQGEAGFRFIGFLPSSATARERAIAALRTEPQACVLFEAPHRIGALAQALSSLLPERQVTVARELTKQFEEIDTLPAAQLPAWFADGPHRGKGEFALVLHPSACLRREGLGEEAQRVLGLLLAELPLKQAVTLAAAITQEGRNTLYAAALAQQAAQR